MNMKPASSSSAYNDPMAILSAGIVSGVATPGALLAIDGNPYNFTIMPQLYPAGLNNVTPNAIRVKGFSGMLTVHLSFSGQLPASWTGSVNIIV